MFNALVMGFVEPSGEVLFHDVIQGLTKEATERRIAAYIFSQRRCWVPASAVDIQWRWLDGASNNSRAYRVGADRMDVVTLAGLESILSGKGQA